MKFLQKLGKALMLPVAVLPICGILMGIGYYLCPATMQGGEVEGIKNLIGYIIFPTGNEAVFRYERQVIHKARRYAYNTHIGDKGEHFSAFPVIKDRYRNRKPQIHYKSRRYRCHIRSAVYTACRYNVRHIIDYLEYALYPDKQ